MSDTATTTEAETAASEGEQKQEQTFTQADVDRIVKDRLSQQAKNKFGDYDELKSQAEGKKTLEERLAGLESELSAAKAAALRSDIAARHGISAEDRDLFLTGTDEDTLTAQAERLAARESDRKKAGNVAPKEGTAKTSGDSKEDEARAFAAEFFGDAA